MTALGELAILIGLAAGLGLLAGKIKQPAILGYIAAGVILQATGLLKSFDEEGLQIFSQIGIIFLLFILGLDLDIRELKKLGRVALVTGLGQIIFTVIIGFLICTSLGFTATPALLIALALTFSSTIVIIKLLSQKKHLDTLYGKLSIAILLIQDFVAIAILILLTSGQNQTDVSPLMQLGLLFIKGAIVAAILWLIDRYFVPVMLKLTGHDREILFIVTIAWAMLFATIIGSPLVGFSIEIGALVAGVALSARKETLQIESWTRPLRDFFLTVFFVLLGYHMHVTAIGSAIVPAIILSIFVLITKPVLVMLILGLFGYNTRISFLTGITIGQISEFSLLLVNLGISYKILSDHDSTLITLVGGITMTISGLMIYYNEPIYTKLKPYLRIFELRKPKNHKYRHLRISNKIIIFGFNRMASELSELINAGEQKFVVIDSDPKVIEYAANLGATTYFGDLSDVDLLKNLKLDQAAMIISTVPEKHANLGLLYHIKEAKIEAPVVVPAFDDEQAHELYQAGADFVSHPYLFASRKLRHIAEKEDIASYITRIAHHDKKRIEHRLNFIR